MTLHKNVNTWPGVTGLMNVLSWDPGSPSGWEYINSSTNERPFTHIQYQMDFIMHLAVDVQVQGAAQPDGLELEQAGNNTSFNP